jgi:hypothetical protein
MKVILLLIVFAFSAGKGLAQSTVQSLPSGTYETVTKTSAGKWERGDLVLLDNTRYRLSTSGEVGEYRFSVTAQKIFFTSGPLKSFNARTSSDKNKPVIVLPLSENDQLQTEVWCYFKQ